MSSLFHTTHQSPLGPILLLGTEQALHGLYFLGQKRQAEVPADAVAAEKPFRRVRALLDEYFAGKAVDFDVPLHLDGTPFQETVWRALLTIPRGQTLSYAALAARVGRPAAVRAVALANACNRISLIIPCHRVIATNGTLTGYAGGLVRKRWLLDMEAGQPVMQQLLSA